MCHVEPVYLGRNSVRDGKARETARQKRVREKRKARRRIVRSNNGFR
jgi:hypothetical protein